MAVASQRVHDSRGAIVEEIRQSIGSGYGIVPLIGSGMSAASGIPAGQDYQAYLFYCLARVFGTDGTTSGTREAWDPSKLRWPSFSEIPKYGDLRSAMLGWSARSQRFLNRARPSRDPAEQQERDALWQACGAVADWRATLNLLSRLYLEERPADLERARDKRSRPNGQPRLYRARLRDPAPRVVDSFFISLTEGRRPNTAHMLLAHLADVLRIKVILTTNFDNLVELAFQRFDMPVATFDVHHEVRLPDARLVRTRRSVVKMHGGRFGLRADFSLDTKPSQDDIDNFVSYLSMYDESGPVRRRHQRNILVMGVSGQERRTIGLLCHAILEFYDPRDQNPFRVFWICHNKNNIRSIEAAFRDQLGTIMKDRGQPIEGAADPLSCLRVTSTPDLGLFLLELYQTIFFCLPTAGVPFNAVWPVPPPSVGAAAGRGLARASKELKAAIQTFLTQQRVHPRPGLLAVTGHSGVPPVATEVFYELRGNVHCIWLEIEKSFDSGDFVMLVLECLAREIGMPPFSAPAPPNPGSFSRGVDGVPESLQKRLDSLISHGSRPFVLFINARYFPGRDESFSTSVRVEFETVMAWLSKRSGLTVVLLTWKSDDQAFLSAATPTWKDLGKCTDLPDAQTVAADLLDITKSIDAEPGLRLAKFTMGLAVFRHPSYLSALQCWALQKAPGRFLVSTDNDAIRFDRAKNELLPALRRCGAIRDDEGQSVFIFPELRERLLKAVVKVRGITPFVRAEAHQGVADWYVKLYRASSDIHAAFESIYHRLQCVRFTGRTTAPEDDGVRIGLRLGALNEMGLTLALIDPTIPSSARLATLIHLLDELIHGASDCLKIFKSKAALRARAKDDARAKTMLETNRANLMSLRARYFAQMGSGPTSPVHKTPRTQESPPTPGRVIEHEIETRLNSAMNARQYASADMQARTLLAELKIKNVFGPAPRDLGREWVLRQPKNERGPIQIAIRTLRRYQLLLLYQAEIVRLNGCPRHEPARDEETLLRNAEKLFVLVTEISRYFNDLPFLNEESALIRAQTGILMSWMNRHRDSHRQYSEAYGYLSCVSSPTAPLRFATVDLRRTESVLCQLENPGRESPLSEQARFGLVYDAISGIERATYKISAIHVRPRWYAWLRELELAVCCQIAALGRGAYRFARCRDRGTLGAWFRESFTEGSYVVGSDPLRLARYLHLADRFVNAGEGIELSPDDRKRIEGLKEWGQGELGKMLKVPSANYDPEVVRYAAATLPEKSTPRQRSATKAGVRAAHVPPPRVVEMRESAPGQGTPLPGHGTTVGNANHRSPHP